ncbi:hypothetical protein [Hirschia litorea]|uniref:Uncharacterized protein n=1 Tax=Hirschia litorea TaxID=1199156 RepID=A0ABW2IN21_9PROT
MAISHFITILSWLLFSLASLSFVALQISPTALPALLDIVVLNWREYIHAPILQFLDAKYEDYIDPVIASLIVFHSLLRQKSRLNRIHKDLAIALTHQPDMTTSIENSLSPNDIKSVQKLMGLAKADKLSADAPQYPRSNWLFTTQSMVLVTLTFSASVWLFIKQVL